jgi:hypothetical protein
MEQSPFIEADRLISQMIKKFLETDVSLPCSEVLATDSYTELV